MGTHLFWWLQRERLPMKFIVTENYEAMSRTAARVISGYVS